MKRWIHASKENISYDEAKYEQLEDVLGECFDPALLPKIKEDWKEFYSNPDRYRGTVVVKLVNQYIDDQPVRREGIVEAGGKFSNPDHDYAASTRRDEIQFDHDVIWTIQFYEKGSDLLYDREVNVWARTYKEAREKANKLCDCFGYPKSACVVQYGYKTTGYWDKYLTEYECDGVEYGE